MDNKFTLNKATINPAYKKRAIIVDDFYQDPDYVRNFALSQNLNAHPDFHKGYRTEDKFFAPNMKEVFQDILGLKIKNWYNGPYCNAVFQYCTKDDELVYHTDGQDWAGAIYLTPDAPYTSGTSLWASKLQKGARDGNDPNFDFNLVFPEDRGCNPFLNQDFFEKVDDLGNVYNRLVLWDANLIHAASEYFGTHPFNSRLFHLFFFDVEK